MNHIQIYEQALNDPTIGYEVKALMRQFYSMELTRASDAIELIKSMLIAKIFDYSSRNEN